MSVLIALLLFFGIVHENPTNGQQINLTQDQNAMLFNSDNYQDYLHSGGTDWLRGGLPAVSIIIHEEK